MKTLFISILLLAGAYTVSSQNIGIQAGIRLNTSTVRYTGVDISRKAGFEGGLSYQHPIGLPGLSLRAALLYFNQEFSLENDMGNNIGITYHFMEDNLKLPLIAEWTPFPTKIKPFVQAGLYTSYAISGNIKDSDSGNRIKYEKAGHRIDYGIVIGAGVYLTRHIILDTRYEHGFSGRNLMLGDQIVYVCNKGYSVSLRYLF
ncbi:MULTISPECIES: porin family protein [Dysgonomonas]|uniref:porin family protein n=1 Tax=Dysgonomonas TaxID=156973 RepID=UPI001883D613|nr:porin family protein [Dysgonomonas sp. GY75]MBF0650064.1 PorT family protein [Dysgonomonas sp. GY75]